MSNWTNGWPARIGMAAVTAALLALTTPGAAMAQSADDETSAGGFELTGYIGAYLPLAKLADSGDTLRAEFSTKVAFGLGLEYWFGSFGIAVNGNYTNPDLTLQIVEDEGFPTSIPLGATELWMAAANVLWRPVLRGSASVVRPYFGAGPGVVKVMYPSDDGFDIQDETRFAISLVGGAQVELSKGWFVRLDVRDYISKFDTEPFAETKTQHDFLTSIGVGYAFH
ncbi:MAG: outer membrane beta-barrel protein [Gemmatimonadetes bacterium]|nr:outer membrane beta-barrel protein [Gemmatimonadota bacterium]NNK48729.1 outer membrane beta-barrel protein [Gemmatimonadota bacterium]